MGEVRKCRVKALTIPSRIFFRQVWRWKDFYGQDLEAKVVSARSAGFYEAKTYVPFLTLVGIHS